MTKSNYYILFSFLFQKEFSEEELGFVPSFRGFFYLAYANVILYLVGFFFKTKKKNLILLLLRKRNVSHINYQTFFAIMSHTVYITTEQKDLGLFWSSISIKYIPFSMD